MNIGIPGAALAINNTLAFRTAFSQRNTFNLHKRTVQISSTLSQPSCCKVLPYGFIVHLYFTLEIKSPFKKILFPKVVLCYTKKYKCLYTFWGNWLMYEGYGLYAYLFLLPHLAKILMNEVILTSSKVIEKWIKFSFQTTNAGTLTVERTNIARRESRCRGFSLVPHDMKMRPLGKRDGGS